MPRHLLLGLFLLTGQPPADTLGDPLPPGAVARLGTARLIHSDNYLMAAFTPDGKTVAVWPEFAGAIRVFETATGKQLPPPEGTANRGVQAAAYSPDGTLLAGAVANHVYFWKTAGYVEAGDLEATGSRILAVAFTNGGKTLVTAGQEGDVRWWDVASRLLVRKWQPYIDETKRTEDGSKVRGFASAVFAPGGGSLAVQTTWVITSGGAMSFDREGLAVLFDLATRKERWRLKDTRQMGICRFAFTPDGKRLAIHGGEADVRLCDAATGRQLAAVPLNRKREEFHHLRALAFSPDGATLALAGSGNEVALWHLDDTTRLREFQVRYAGYVNNPANHVAFTPDGKRLLACVGRSLQFFDAATLAEAFPGPAHRGSVPWLRFTADGKSLFSASGEGPAFPGERITWDTATWKPVRRALIDGRTIARTFGWAADHRVILASEGNGDDLRLALFDPTTRNLLARLQAPAETSYVFPFFSPAGSLVVVEGSTRQDRHFVWLFATDKGKLVADLSKHGSAVGWAFSADEQLAAVYVPDGRILVFDTALAKRVAVLGAAEATNPPEMAIAALAFSPDARRLAAWSRETREVVVWDIAAGKIRQRLPLQTPAGRAWYEVHLAWSPDGRVLAVSAMTAEADIHLWELGTNKVRRVLQGQSPVTALAFSPDGRLLASGADDSTVTVWDPW
jgi:WD40 repeat protein